MGVVGPPLLPLQALAFHESEQRRDEGKPMVVYRVNKINTDYKSNFRLHDADCGLGLSKEHHRDCLIECSQLPCKAGIVPI